MQKIEHFSGSLHIRQPAGLLAPFYIGLVGAIAILLFKFVKEFIHLLR